MYSKLILLWKLKENEVRDRFLDKVRQNAGKISDCDDDEEDVEKLWGKMKSCLLGTADDVCGRSRGGRRHRETWWWNEECAKAVDEKIKFYEVWQRTRTDSDKKAYNSAKQATKKVIAKAQQAERVKFCDMLEKEEGRGNLFRVVKQMVSKE